MAKERASFFSLFEQEIILKTFEEYKSIITAKCNTAAAAKSREEAWQKIADKINAANPNNVKRTWQQVKMKYKNIVQCANRKRKQRFSDALETASFSPAEEVALWQIRGRPVIDATILGLSSEQTGIAESIATGAEEPSEVSPEMFKQVEEQVPSGYVPVPAAKTSLSIRTPPSFNKRQRSDSEHEEKNIVVCSQSEEKTEVYTSQDDPGPSGPLGPADGERDEDVTSLYKRYLRQEIAYRQLKMKKLEKEIQLLDKQLDTS